METELRSQQVQFETKENKIVGIIKYNIRSQLIGGNFYEIIAPNAFTYDTVKALWNHDTNIVLGSTRSKTLTLQNTQDGLGFEIDLPQTRSDILENVKRGDVDGTSFGMMVIKDSWNYDEEYPVRTILKAELYEISPTPFPAYEENTISTRALEQSKNNNKGEEKIMENQKEMQELYKIIEEGASIEDVKAKLNEMLNKKDDNKEDGESVSVDKEQLRSVLREIEKEENSKRELRGALLSPSSPQTFGKREFRDVFRSIITNQVDASELRTLGISNGETGGYLIGDEFHNKIIEMKKSLTDLSKYCNVMPVGSKTGTIPVEKRQAMVPMQIVREGEGNKDGQEPKFFQVKYDVKDMREVYKLANSFVKDQQVDIMGYLAKKIAEKDTFSTNYYIINGFDIEKATGLLRNPVFKSEKITTAITLAKMKSMINSFDAALRSDLKVIVNNDGYNLLSTIEYTDGRLVMQEDATLDSGYRFLGKEVVELNQNELPNDDTDGTPIIIANVKEAVTIFDRQAYEVKASEEAGFDDDSTKVRVIVRKDVKTGIDETASRTIFVKL